jgi:hypothetical protein
MSPHSAVGCEETGAEFDVEQEMLNTSSAQASALKHKVRLGPVMMEGSLLRPPVAHQFGAQLRREMTNPRAGLGTLG